MTAYYNEIDHKAAEWLRELIKTGLIPNGEVDERSIVEVRPEELTGYTACHFFAGIGGWAYALRLAGWPEDEPVWTGSCPCQPFSAAGKRKGTADSRHLWPVWRGLIEKCRPATVFGEQVASKFGREWLYRVRADLEELGYAVGAADLCAACVGSPQIRQRLWWVAESGGRRQSEHKKRDGESQNDTAVRDSRGIHPHRHGDSGGMGDADCARKGQVAQVSEGPGVERGGGFWDTFDLIPCSDGKSRRVEPGTFPLAHGVPGRVGLLRGYGNAIVPEVAAEFIKAWIETHE